MSTLRNTMLFLYLLLAAVKMPGNKARENLIAKLIVMTATVGEYCLINVAKYMYRTFNNNA